MYESLYEWGLIESVEALCCDTTNSNTGCKAGAAVLLKLKLNKDILYLLFHHILEFILGADFTTRIPKSNEPNVTIFTNFRNQWSSIDTNLFQSGLVKINPLLLN